MLPQILLSLALLNLFYLTAFFAISIWLNVAETHYFLGYGKKFIRFTIRQTTFHIGVYIPIVMLSPIYTITNDGQRMKYPWEFFGEGIFRRFVATLGGAIGLILSAILIFTALAYFTPDYVISKEEVNKHGIEPSEWAMQSGFVPGDKIVAVNGKDYETFQDLISPGLITAPEVSYTVLRDGKEIEIKLQGLAESLNRRGDPFIYPRIPAEVLKVVSNSPADQAGIKPGDRITMVNDKPVTYIKEVTSVLKEKIDEEKVLLTIERKTPDSTQTLTLEVFPGHQSVIGVQWNPSIAYTEKRNSLLQALWMGPARAFTTLKTNVIAFGRIISGVLAPKQSLSGPIGIANGPTIQLWTITGVYALIYACYNLLPLPRSAFWELIALAYEGITKRKYPDRLSLQVPELY
ncbi:PDZ domain-containing protein [Fulvivirgaceae bacterium PWU4]|uniref:PDZ domain-containing protein n=1 Tax=Chryseosolibacter histidini TaxID=2782349 RepID=A0AAP2DLF9_9BACT|nr:PDZ domain-containing protein [Chryseosolibacter histidini]MBT1697107.1 PDZ domain-containing protein [Chryseosolibacter histidini]